MSARQSALLAMLFVLGAAPAARADIVELANGRTLEGKVVREGGKIRVETPGRAAAEFDEADVKQVLPGTWRDEYARRRAGLPAGDGEAHYRLAAWCATTNLGEEYAAELRETLKLVPAHAFARQRLEALERRAAEAEARAKPAEAVPEPAAKKPEEGQAKAAPAIHQVAKAHVTASSDASPASAEDAAEAGEESVRLFTEFMGLDPADARLKGFRVSVRCYAADADYRAVAAKFGIGVSAGFYTGPQAGCHIRGSSSEKTRPLMRLHVRHEVGHALAFQVLGIGMRRLWLHETLAAVVEGTGQDGLGDGAKSNRLMVLAGMGEGRVGLTIKELLASSFQGDRTDHSYLRAWSFAHFVFHGADAERRKEFLAFLQDARGWATDVDAAFARHFPDQAGLAEARPGTAGGQQATFIGQAVTLPAAVPSPPPAWVRRQQNMIEATS